MQKSFVYRTAPELRFQISLTSKNGVGRVHKSNNIPLLTEKRFFKTKQNILTQRQMGHMKNSILLKNIQATNTQRQIEPKFKELQQIDLKQLKWDKWRRPISVVRFNKNALGRLYSETKAHHKRLRTHDSQQQFMSSLSKGVLTDDGSAKSDLLKLDREHRKLKRLKTAVQEKHKVLNLMQEIQAHSSTSIKGVFNRHRDQAQELFICPTKRARTERNVN